MDVPREQNFIRFMPVSEHQMKCDLMIIISLGPLVHFGNVQLSLPGNIIMRMRVVAYSLPRTVIRPNKGNQALLTPSHINMIKIIARTVCVRGQSRARSLHSLKVMKRRKELLL